MSRWFYCSVLSLFLTLPLAAQGAPSCKKIFRLSVEQILAKDHNNNNEMRYTILKKNEGEPTVVVYLNSLTYFLEGIKEIKGIEAYTNRLLGPAIQEIIHNPNVSIVYPTNQLVSRAELLHFARPYIREAQLQGNLKPNVVMEQEILNRLKIVYVRQQQGSNILAHHLLSDPVALAEIKKITGLRNAYIQSYTATPLETTLAAKLQLPINASPRTNQLYGNTKSGNHEIFVKAGVPHPKGKINLSSRREVAQGILELWKETGHEKYMIKLEESSSGKGNASFTLNPQMVVTLKMRLARSERHAIDYLMARLYTGLKPQGTFNSKEYWDIEFKAQGSIMVEQFIKEYREGTDPSPSVQFHIGTDGRIRIVSTHEQIFHPENKQTFIGSQYPAQKKYRKEIVDYSIKIAEKLQEKGMLGHGGIDFIVTKEGKIYAIEINARMNGTSHSFLTAKGLQKDQAENFFSISTDNFESPYLKKLSVEQLLSLPRIKPLLYNVQAGHGITFHIMGAMPSGKIGFQAIGRTRKEAQDLYDQVLEILDP